MILSNNKYFYVFHITFKDQSHSAAGSKTNKVCLKALESSY